MTDQDKKIQYQQFLEEKHKQFQTPDTILQDIVQEGIGSNFDSKTRIIKGEVNEVYDITVQNNHFILRLSRAEDWKPYVGESWALKQCKILGLPVPEILSIQERKLDGKPLYVCIENKLPGEPLNELVDENRIEKSTTRNILNQTGEILTAMHTIPTNGFDAINKYGMGLFDTFEKFMQKREKDKDVLYLTAKKFHLDESTIDNALRVLAKHSLFFGVVEPVLNHHDLSPKHILVDKGKVTGIIDFETCIGNHPLYDFARWNFYHDDYPLEWLQEGYDNKSLFDEKYKDRIHFFKIFFALGVMQWYGNDDHPGAIIAKRNLVADLEYFKSL